MRRMPCERKQNVDKRAANRLYYEACEPSQAVMPRCSVRARARILSGSSVLSSIQFHAFSTTKYVIAHIGAR
jgi:hypothetical protein